MTKERALVFLSETERELGLLESTVKLIQKRLRKLGKISNEEDYAAYIESLALNLHSFYEGIETVFEKVTDFTGEDKPAGYEWHISLLEIMTLPIKHLRPEVISKNTARELDTFRAFRHKIRHIYGFMIIPENVIELSEKISRPFKAFQNDINSFLKYIKKLAQSK